MVETVTVLIPLPCTHTDPARLKLLVVLAEHTLQQKIHWFVSFLSFWHAGVRDGHVE